MVVLEVFSCSGGMAEGLRRAGLPVTMAFDKDPDAIASYTANLGHAPVQMDARDLLRLVEMDHLMGLAPARGSIDLLVADPPCTPWSRAGKRLGQEDERDMLAVSCDLVRLLQPACFLIANVPGLDDAPNWPTVQRTIGSLSRGKNGWCVDFVHLDAADFGVPQHRIRPFWFGHAKDTPCIVWPERTHGPKDRNATLPGVRALLPWVTCRDALGHLPAKDLGAPVKLRWRGVETVFDGPNHRPSRSDKPARTVTRNTHSDGALLTHPRHPVSQADEPSYTVTTKGDGRGAQGACVIAYDGHPINRVDEPALGIPSSQPGNGGAVLAWPWEERGATTVTTRGTIPPPGHHPESGSILSQPNAVKLSEKAAAILQGFPETWVFCGATKRARWSQIGQAMPPPLAEAVGRSVARQMGAAAPERKVGAR